MPISYHAIRVTTGVGKTRLAAEAIAEEIKRKRAAGEVKPFLYAVPTHRLGDEIEVQFAENGVTARVFRGRQAPDPERPGHAMCDDIQAVEVALKLGAPVARSCCKGSHNGQTVKCAHYETCAYQRQRFHRPDVWLVAHQLLFHRHDGIKKVAGVVIDEGFWQAGLWFSKRDLTLDQIETVPFGERRLDAIANDIEPLRLKLARALRRQPHPGGLQRQHLVEEGLSRDLCSAAIKLEYRLKGKPTLWPGMPAEERKKAAEKASYARYTSRYVQLWRAARDLLQAEENAVSGRITLAERKSEDGTIRVVKTRGVRSIAKRWAKAPTFVMDATLPDLAVLRIFYPKIEMVADVDATMPHVSVRQVVGAPVAAKKLGIVKEQGQPPRVEPAEGNRNIQAIRRAILHRHLQLGRQPTLVIAQMAVATWLKTSGLPPAIAVEHFNAISGLDQYREVRYLVTIGRTLPSVLDVEAYAGALTGLEPIKTAQPPVGPRWFDRPTRGIRLKDGTGHAVEGDVHPDPMAEAIRWQICEGELVQAIGRGRGVNRTATTPLVIDIMADVVLPLTVDEVVSWEKVSAGPEVEMLAEGIWLDSPSDMARCWPKVWETKEAAKQWLKRVTRCQSPIEDIRYRRLTPCEGRYQLPGARQKWRTFRFSHYVVSAPRAWLEARLGPLAGFEVDDPFLRALDVLFDAAATREQPPACLMIVCSKPRHDEPAPCARGHVRLFLTASPRRLWQDSVSQQLSQRAEALSHHKVAAPHRLA